MLKIVTILSAIAALGGCSIAKDVPAADTAVVAFHKQLDAGQFDAIYLGASPDLKNITPEVNLTRLLAAVHRKLGLFKTGKSIGWNDNHTTGGHFISVNYAATYERGEAQENFIYRLDGGHALLAGYHVNSDALILN